MGAPVGKDTDGFDSVESAVSSAYVAGDGAGGGDVGTFEVDVIGDQKAASSDSTGTSGFVKFRAADVGPPSGVTASGVTETFELALADIFELNAIRTGGSGPVEVDGYAITTP